MSVLSCVSQNGETMRNIFSGHIKMNYSCGEDKHSALRLYLQVNGKYTYYHIDCFLPHWGDFYLYFIKCVHTNKDWDEEGFNGIHWGDSSSRHTVFNRNHKRAALHYSLQCKQLGPKPLHSTAHLLATAPTHIFMYSCVYQNLAAYVAFFSL